MNTDVNIMKDTKNTDSVPELLPRSFSVRRFARSIGVSHTTVYNVLNGVEKVGPETRAMIIEKLWECVKEKQPAPAA